MPSGTRPSRSSAGPPGTCYIAGTYDYAYSVPLCHVLARVNPSAALHNADSYSFFATLPVGGSCLGFRNIANRVIDATRRTAEKAVRATENAAKKASDAVRGAVHKAEETAKKAVKSIKKRLHH